MNLGYGNRISGCNQFIFPQEQDRLTNRDRSTREAEQERQWKQLQAQRQQQAQHQQQSIHDHRVYGTFNNDRIFSASNFYLKAKLPSVTNHILLHSSIISRSGHSFSKLSINPK